MSQGQQAAAQLPDLTIETAARARQASLTKPPGSLGRLEDLACWLAARLGEPVPAMPVCEIVVFAADHGVAARGVSAFPQAVTAQMVQNFARGGAAINVLAKLNDARVTVVDIGVATEAPSPSGVRHERIAPGTQDLSTGPAMTLVQAERALLVGKRCATEAAERGARLLIAGEMGIANTTAAACLICALTNASPDVIVGRGTGVSDQALEYKRTVVTQALKRAQTNGASEPLEIGCPSKVASGAFERVAKGATFATRILAELGGFELAAMAGLYIEAARRGVPIMLDGYLSAAAALVAVAIDSNTRHWMLASHLSAEAGHAAALEALDLAPLLRFDMRLGEGSGAALSLSIVRAALALHREMATFAEAGVSDGATG
jgi:nicotinate-nucleotide--dimethylbenzimidazole phosphoribosyltransferase